MSWTHYNHPIFVGSIKSRTTSDSNLHWRNYIIGDTSGYTKQKEWTWGTGQSIQAFCTANNLTLHYVDTGDGGNTTNTGRSFKTFGPQAVVLDPETTESDLSGLTGLTNAVTITAGSSNTKNLNTLISEYNADSGNTLTKTLTYDGDGNLASITKDYA
jgi:hypothetical protein